MHGTFIPIACLLILLQDVCIESVSVVKRRSTDDDDSETDDDYGTDEDDPDELVPEKSTEIVVIDEKQATVSEDDETTKLSHSYLPTIRYIEENHKPIVFIRESEEIDDPDELVPEQSTEITVVEEKQATVSKDDKITKRSHSYLPTIRHIKKTHKPMVFIRASKERDVKYDDFDNLNDEENENQESESSDDYDYNHQDSLNYKSKSSDDDNHYGEDSQNDESESQSDYDEQLKENNHNDEEYDDSSSEDENEYETNDYRDRNRKKSKGRFKGSKKKNMRPMKQHSMSDKFKEDFREPEIGINIKVTAERNSRKSRFTHRNETEVPETDEELLMNKTKRQENSKVYGGILKLHKMKNSVTGLTEVDSYSKARSLAKTLNNTKEIYDNSVGRNDSSISNNTTKNINPKLFDKLKKSFRNHLENYPPLAKESAAFKNIRNGLRSFGKSNRQVKSLETDHQSFRSHQEFQKGKRNIEHHSNLKMLKKLLDKDRNLRSQLHGLKKTRYKRVIGEDDKTGELLDQLEDMLIKANIAQQVNSELKSTAAPIEVFDFTPMPDSDSLMSESDLSKLFVEHIIPFLAKNSKLDAFTHEPMKKIGMPTIAIRKKGDDNVLKIKITNQEFGVNSRDERSEDNKHLLNDVFFSPKFNSKSTARKLMTEDKVHIEDSYPLSKTQIFPFNLENSFLNVSKRNSETEEEFYNRNFKNRYFNSDRSRPEHSSYKLSQFDPSSKMNNSLLDTYDEKEDGTFPENQVIQTHAIPKYPSLDPRTVDLTQSSNNPNFPLRNSPGNSHRNNGYSNYGSLKNYSDINVLNIPEPSTLVSESSASDAINYQQTPVSTDYTEDLLITTVEGIYISERLSTASNFLNLNRNSSNVYISPKNVDHTENSTYIYMSNKSENASMPPELRETSYSLQNDREPEKLTYKKAIPSISRFNAQNDAIEISIKIPESILRQFANEAILDRNNERSRQAPGMSLQVLSTNQPSFIGTEKILKSSDNKTKDFKIGETMVDHRSEYMTDKDIDDVKIKRNFQKEILASNKSSTFDDGQENKNSDLPTSTDLLNHKQMTFPNSSLQRKYLANTDKPILGESSTSNSIAETHDMEDKSSNDLNNATANEHIINKASAKRKRKKSHKVLLKNKKLNGHQKVMPEKYLMSNKNFKNENQEKMPFNLVQIEKRKRAEETNNKAQMNRRSFHSEDKSRHRKHKRRLRKSGRSRRMKIKKYEKSGIIKKRSTTTTDNKYKFNDQSTQSASFESNNVKLKISPDLFLDWIISSSKDFNKLAEPLGSNYNDVPLNLSFLTDSKNMNFEVPKDLSLVNSENVSKDNSHATGIETQNFDDVHKIQNKSAWMSKKKLEFERNIDSYSKPNNSYFSEKMLQNLTGPEVNALLFGNTSLDTFLDAFYKISRNTTSLSPEVLQKNHRQTTTAKILGLNRRTTTANKMGADHKITITKKQRINLRTTTTKKTHRHFRTTTTQKQHTNVRTTTTKKQHRHFRTTAVQKQHTGLRITTTKKQHRHFRTTKIKKQHKNLVTPTTKKQSTKLPLIIFHKSPPKKNGKLSQEQIKHHHHSASQENTKKKTEERKKLHKLTQNLKKVVWKYVNRLTNDESKKKLMYHAALKKLPSILKKHIKVQT